MSQNQHEGPRWKLIITLITLAGVIVTATCVLNGPAASAHVSTSTPSPTRRKRSNIPTSPPTITITPTSTLSPTDTPTPTPTATPTPKPDAVVNVEALNLRSGPGVVYGILGVLKRGDCLKIVCKCPAGEWVKVICPRKREGWVKASLLEINLPLTSVPVGQVPPTPTPMYTPTLTATPTPVLLSPPILLEPENGASFIGPVLLKWEWIRPLAPDEIFSVRVYKEGEKELCHHSQVHGTEYSGGLTYCKDGKHYWGVAVARQLEGCLDKDDVKCWENLSEPSAQRWIYYTPVEEPWEPPTSTPTPGGSGGGDGGDNGGGGGVPGG